MADYVLKQTGRLPDLEATLVDETNTAPTTELTSGTLTFHMRRPGTTTAIISASATVVSAAAGTVKYVWGASDTLDAGHFEAEFKLVYGGKAYYFPSDGYLDILIVGNIA